MAELTFTAVFIDEGDMIVAWVEELPGANTQGATMEEARTNLREAVQLILEENRAQATRNLAGHVAIRESLAV